MIVNLAQRAHNRNFEADEIIRSVLDLDMYKLLMAQFIWKHFPATQVTFALMNRTKRVLLVDQVPEVDLRRQLDHVRTLRLRKSERIWLAGNSFFGRAAIFEPAFLDALSHLRLPDYRLEAVDGQWKLTFSGTWFEVTLWELYALAIVSELRTRSGLARLSEFELDILYARAKAKLWAKIERLRDVPGLRISDFGTRRRHSFLWQEYAVLAMKSELPDIFVGTSNVYLAYKHDMEAMGTNAHELPMVLAALAGSGKLGAVGLRESQYEVLRLWKETYPEAMHVMLPDTFGTTQFLQGAPDWVADFTGDRLDSKEPFEAGEEYLAWVASRGRDPRSKLLIPSDGLDVDDILGLHAQFGGRVAPGVDARTAFRDARDFSDPAKWTHEPRCRVSMGWGTMLTNDFVGCHPRDLPDFDPISLVCKVAEAEGSPAVKLSDNWNKATGPADEVKRYRAAFGTEGIKGAPVVV
jgi:nicotinate phosphoribosyltransferase